MHAWLDQLSESRVSRSAEQLYQHLETWRVINRRRCAFYILYNCDWRTGVFAAHGTGRNRLASDVHTSLAFHISIGPDRQFADLGAWADVLKNVRETLIAHGMAILEFQAAQGAAE